MMNRIVTLTAVFALWLLLSFAPAQVSWRHIPFNDLPTKTIMFCINSDTAGNIFLGRAGSLERYDGQRWTKLYYDTSGVGNNGQFDIRDIRFHNGGFWASTNHGLLRYAGGVAHRIQTENTPSLYEDHIRGLALDQKGDPWFLSWVRALSRLDTQIGFVMNLTLPDGTPTPSFSDASMFVDSRWNAWWLCGGNKIVRCAEGNVMIFDSSLLPILKTDTIHNIWVNPSGSMYVLLKQRVLKCTPSGGLLTCDTLPLPLGLLDANEFFNLCTVDGTRQLWATVNINNGVGIAGKKVLRFDATNRWTRFDYPIINGKDRLTVVDFCADPKGDVWFAAQDQGIYILTPSPVTSVSMRNDVSAGMEDAIHVSMNPQANEATIEYFISSGGWIALDVFDMLGHRAPPLLHELKEAGRHYQQFRIAGHALRSGVYFIRLTTERSVRIAKLLITHAQNN